MHKSKTSFDKLGRPPFKQTMANFSRRLHVYRRDTAKAKVDNKSPKSYPHTFINLKGLQMKEDKSLIIQRQNRNLSERILRQMVKKSQIDNNFEHSYDHRITKNNLLARERDLMQLVQKNQAMLKRIVSVKPHYNMNKYICKYEKEKMQTLQEKGKMHAQAGQKQYLKNVKVMAKSRNLQPENYSRKLLKRATKRGCSNRRTDKCGDNLMVNQYRAVREPPWLLLHEDGRPIRPGYDDTTEEDRTVPHVSGLTSTRNDSSSNGSSGFVRKEYGVKFKKIKSQKMFKPSPKVAIVRNRSPNKELVAVKKKPKRKIYADFGTVDFKETYKLVLI